MDFNEVRELVAREFGDDEVWELIKTYRIDGVRVEVWSHPTLGFSVKAEGPDGHVTQSNPENDPATAVAVAHLREFRRD